MPARPAKPNNVPWMMPYLTVRDSAKALEHYEKAFGFTRGFCHNGPDGRIMHAEMHYKDMRFMFGPEGPNCPAKTPATSGVGSPVGLYFYVEDVDAAFKRAVAAGCTAQMNPQEMFWGDRMASVKCAEGYLWSMATNVGDFDASKVIAQAGGL